MSRTGKLAVAVAGVAGLSFTVVGVGPASEAHASPAAPPAPGNPTITITAKGTNYTNSPAQVNAKVGQAITIINKDPLAAHTVTAKDRSFDVNVPANGTVTLTVPKAGSYPYYCTYHPESHNPATITVS